MTHIIKVKNKTNWMMSIFRAFALIIITFVIIVVVPLATIQETYFLSILTFLITVIPFLIFFIIILHLWLWNVFGKTIIEKQLGEIIVAKKYNLFFKTKTYSTIDKIIIKNYKIERRGYYTRYNFSFSNAVYSIVFIVDEKEIRIIDWLTEKKANEILKFINDSQKENLNY